MAVDSCDGSGFGEVRPGVEDRCKGCARCKPSTPAPDPNQNGKPGKK